MRKQTWFGVVVCLLGLLPGLAAGAVVAFLYRYQFREPDLLGLQALFGSNLLSAINAVFKWIFFGGIPSAIHGGIAGAIAIFLANFAYTGGRLSAVARKAGLIVTTFMLVVTFVGLFTAGWQLSLLEAWLQIVGFWIGLASTASALAGEY
jgi:hypothetical protein